MAKVAESSVAAIAMAIAGRSSRACDVCATKGAHWFCAADDAYLCTACDTQVHSANALSLRHERVRLSSSGAPVKAKQQDSCKRVHPSPGAAPVRKRSRTARPYSHHLRKLTQVVKAEEPGVVKAELELFDFSDADEFLVAAHAGNQEVPNLVASSSTSSEEGGLGLVAPEYDHSASADSFAAFFKGKAAQLSQSVVDEFLVPDTGFESSSPSDDAFFFPGDIPGLDTLIVPAEVDLPSDDFSLSFDLALQNGVETFEGEQLAVPAPAPAPAVAAVTASPFSKWFATKREPEADEQEPLSPERVRRDAKAMLKCCCDLESAPSLQLNLQDVLAAWSNRDEPWIVDSSSPSSTSSAADGAGLVPDLGACDDQSQSSGDRDARVLRYKEKRRTRLFSKKIRYEVRKLNAERRPRMKGRFVKRTAATTTS